MPASPNPARERLLNAILARAAIDPVFRTGLLTDPKGTINQAFNVSIPAEFSLRFIERDPGLDLLVVLPELQQDSEQLEGDALAAVNGGNSNEPGDEPILGPDEAPW
jgi:hypothetical protein